MSLPEAANAVMGGTAITMKLAASEISADLIIWFSSSRGFGAGANLPEFYDEASSHPTRHGKLRLR